MISASLIVALLLPLAAAAQMIFERADITINPRNIEGMPARLATKYNIEVRNEEAVLLEYIHTLNTLGEDGGVAITFTDPTYAALPDLKVYTPVDALFVADDGTIVQIYPGVVLGSIDQNIMAKDPVKAFIFLRNGVAKTNNIQPGDVVDAPMFAAAPPVQDVPIAPKPEVKEAAPEEPKPSPPQSPQTPAPSDTRPPATDAPRPSGPRVL